ncbi:MAG TPA: class I SAM-dependent methyltransferase [Bacteroidales bacterium]|nr:class I SAM-dependent methyltransferase [Bacteroidales bacterium]
MSLIYPDFFARFYDLIYGKLRSSVDTEYFLRKAREAKGPVLEIGTGTGRIFLEALKQGADIYGIDISPEMIAVLKSRLDPVQHNRVSVQDMRNFFSDRSFSLILAPFRVFMHLTETQDQLAALNHIHSFLEPGGAFIFDLFIPDMKIIEKGMQDVVDFEGEYRPGEMVRRTTSSRSNMERHITYVTMKFDWTENGEWKTGTFFTQMRFFFLRELEELLEHSAFRKFDIFGNYLEEPVGSGSKDYLVVCTK